MMSENKKVAQMFFVLLIVLFLILFFFGFRGGGLPSGYVHYRGDAEEKQSIFINQVQIILGTQAKALSVEPNSRKPGRAWVYVNYQSGSLNIPYGINLESINSLGYRKHATIKEVLYCNELQSIEFHELQDDNTRTLRWYYPDNRCL